MKGEIFQVVDYVVVGAMLVVSCLIGLYFRFTGGRQKSAAEYLMAGRNMAILPVVLSLTATTQTAIGTLGFPGEIYLYGAALFWYPLGFAVALIICIFVYTPVYFGIQCTSAYEYLERRYGKITRTVISGLFIIQMIFFMSIGLYSPSIALSAVSGLSHFVSILTVGIVCTFYCTLGGMKAVLWTDFFQSILMLLALFSVIVKGTMDVGGFSEVIRIATDGGRLDLLDFQTDMTLRFNIISTLIGGFMYGLTTSGGNQTQIQRLLTLSTLRRSQLALILSIPLNLLFYYTIFTCGVVIYANFSGCDPLLMTEESGISSADQLIPYYMIRSFLSIPGMAGFCVSGVFCAALTSISSAVNSLAAVTTEDFAVPFCNRRGCMTPKMVTKVSKFFALFYSVLSIAMTYIVGNIKAIISAGFVIFTALGGPIVAIITLGMLTSTANQKGILIGLLSGVCLNAWIGVGSLIAQYPQVRLEQSIEYCPATSTASILEETTLATIASFNHTTASAPLVSSTDSSISILPEDVFPLFKLGFYLHPVPGTILTFVIGYLASIFTGGNKSIDLNLISPCVRRWHKSKAADDTKNSEVAAAMSELQNEKVCHQMDVVEQSKL